MRWLAVALLFACRPSPSGGDDTDGVPDDTDPAIGEDTDTAEPTCASLEVIRGDVRIERDEDLARLRCVREITGGLAIVGTTLTSLAELSALTRIDDTLVLEDDDALTSLAGLGALQVLGGLDAHGNAALASLEGLGPVTALGTLSLVDDPALASLAGLGSLATVDNLILQHDGALTSLAGLDALTGLGSLNVDHDDALTSLAGLGGVTTLRFADINHDVALTSLAGLDALVSVVDHLDVTNNPALTSLAALGALETVGALWVERNGALCQSQVDDLDARLAGECTRCLGNRDDC